MTIKSSARVGVLIGLLGLSLALAGCGSDSTGTSASSTRTVNVDGVSVKVSGPLKLAVFVGGTGNTYAATLIDGFKKAVAAQPGATVTIFDGKYDPATQINQLTNAIQSGRYNAFSLGAADPRLACDVATKQAAKAGILVVAELLPLCARASESGDQLRAPGTLSFVGGPYLYEYFVDYLTEIAQRNPGAQRVVVLSGPPLNPISINLAKAVKDVEASFPDFDVVSIVDTDFTTKTGNEKIASQIQAHPDTTILFSPISDLTKGAVSALKSAGKDKQVKIYDIAGDTWDFKAVEYGTLAATAIESPSSSAKTIVDVLVKARAGKSVEPFYLNSGLPLDPSSPKSGLTIVTSENINDYSPQF